jgi:hypothetical protein
LIAGVVVGALSVVTAAVLTLAKDDDESSSHTHLAIPGPVASPGAVAAAPSPAPASVPAPVSVPTPPSVPSPIRDPGPAIDEPRARESRAVAASPSEAASAEASPVGAVRNPRDGRRPTAAPVRPRDRSPEAVPRPGNAAATPDTAPGRVRERAPEDRAPDAAAHEARPARPEPPRIDGPAPGISTAELGKLYDAVRAEIEQQPEASRQDLRGQLAMINILRAMRESQQTRDDAAAQLWKLRQRMSDRKATR